MKTRKLLAQVAAVLLVGGALALSPSMAATAHTGGVTGVAACEADGTYTVTWTYNAANVPDGVEAETKAMTTTPGTLVPIDGVDKGGQIFLSVWTDHQVNVPGAPVKTGNWSAQFKTVGIPGTATEVTTMVQTDWKNGPSEDPIGKVVLDGKCTPPVEEPPVVIPPEPEGIDTTDVVEVVDCETKIVTITTTRTFQEWIYVEESNTWETPGLIVDVTETTREATPEECPVVVPPVVEPPVVEPPVVEPPVVEPPVADEPVVVAQVDKEPVALRLAETGSEAGAYGATLAALASALVGVGILMFALRRRLSAHRNQGE